MMKKLILVAVLSALAFPAGGIAQGLKIGTVDMSRAIKEYNKTRDAEKKINDAREAAKKEYDDRADSYKKALNEINQLNQQLEAPALSRDAKTQKAKDRDEKIASIKNLEREIDDFRQTREKELQDQSGRMRDEIVNEVTAVVMAKVKSSSMDLVLDISGVSVNGVPTVMFANPQMDFTNDIIAQLNKPSNSPTPATKSSPSAKTKP